MVLAAYAVGYDVPPGYAGLMSLGHAMFFAAGMYGTGLSPSATWASGVAAGFACRRRRPRLARFGPWWAS